MKGNIKMRLVPVGCLKENTVIAIDVINSDGRILLKRNQRISKFGIDTLNRLGVTHVYIRDEFCYNNDDRYTVDLCKFSESIIKLKQIASKVSSGTSGEADIKAAYDVARKIVLDLNKYGNDFKIVYEPSKMIVNSLVERCIYVAIMSTALGFKMKLRPEQLIKLCLAALLKDVALFSPKIKAMDENVYYHHPLSGYQHLKENYNLDEDILNAVLHHHELKDGTGFPNKLTGNDICQFARIIGVIDKFYEIKSSHEMLSGAQDTFESALQSIVKMYDTEVLSYFFKETEIFTLDTLVRLNSGDIAVIMQNNSSNILRPVIKIIKSNYFRSGEEIELQKYSKLKIESIVYYVD